MGLPRRLTRRPTRPGRENCEPVSPSPRHWPPWRATRPRTCARRIGNLGDKETSSLAVAWMSAGTAWESRKPGDLGWLATSLAAGGDATKEARRRLAAQLLKKQLATPEAVREGRCQDWKEIAGALAKDLDADARAVWAAKIRGAFTDAKTLASLGKQDVTDLVDALVALEAKDAYGVVADWIAAGDAWRAAGAGDLAWVIESLEKAGDGTKAARVGAIDQATAKFLGSAEAARVVPWTDWRSLAAACGRNAEPAVRKTWAEKLQGYFGDAKTLASLKPSDAQDLTQALVALRR